MSRPLVLQTEHLDATWASWLRERCELVECPFAEPEKFDELLPRAEGLVVRTYTQVNAALLDRAPRLKVVGRGGVGLENIDVAECLRRGVKVVHTPEANVQAVSEFVIAVLLDVLRPRHYIDHAPPESEWRRLRKELVGPRQVSELTMGIYGFGRIGRRVARVFSAFRGRVIYHDLLSFPPLVRSGAEPVTREKLLAEADVVSLHVDARPENHHLFSTDSFSRMKPDAIFLNMARGMLVDAPALSAWLRANPHAAAVLDVHDPEPFSGDYPLLGLPNVRLSPHLAAGTLSAQREMSAVVKDIWRVLVGEEPEFPAPEP